MNDMQISRASALVQGVLCTGILCAFGAASGREIPVECIEVHVTRALLESTDDAQILAALAHEESEDLFIYRSEYCGLAWWSPNGSDQFALQLNESSGTDWPEGGADPGEEMSFNTKSLLCGESRRFGWEGVGNNVVEVYERGNYPAPFDARLHVCREIFTFTVDPNRALVDFAGIETYDDDDRVNREDINGKIVERLSEITDSGRKSYVRVVDNATGRVVRWHWIESCFATERSMILLVRVLDQRNCDRLPVEIDADGDADVADRLHEIHFDVKGAGPLVFDVHLSRNERNPEGASPIDPGENRIAWFGIVLFIVISSALLVEVHRFLKRKEART